MRHEKAALAQFAAALGGGLPPLTLLTGPAWFQSQAANRLAAALGDPAGVTRWNEAGFDARAFFEEAAGRSLFSARRVLIALGLKDKDARALAELDAAQRLFAAPPDGIALCLGFVEARALTAKFFAAPAVERWDFAPLYPDKLPGFAADLARERGFALPQRAAEAVAQASAGELSLIAAEVDKLALLAGGGKLDEALALAVIAAPDAAEFELSGHVETGNLPGALATLEGECAGGVSFQEVSSAISGSLGALLLARKAPPGGLAALLRKPPFIADRIGRAAARLSEARLRGAVRRLARLEWRTRQGLKRGWEAELTALLRAALTPASAR